MYIKGKNLIYLSKYFYFIFIKKRNKFCPNCVHYPTKNTAVVKQNGIHTIQLIKLPPSRMFCTYNCQLTINNKAVQYILFFCLRPPQ